MFDHSLEGLMTFLVCRIVLGRIILHTVLYEKGFTLKAMQPTVTCCLNVKSTVMYHNGYNEKEI